MVSIRPQLQNVESSPSEGIDRRPDIYQLLSFSLLHLGTVYASKETSLRRVCVLRLR